MNALYLFLILLPFGLLLIGFLIRCACAHYKVWQAHLIRHEIINETWKEEMEIFHDFRRKGVDFSYPEFKKFMYRMIYFKKVEESMTDSLIQPRTLQHRWYRFNKKRPNTSASHSAAIYS